MLLLRNGSRVLKTIFTKKGTNVLKVQTPMIGVRTFHNPRSDPFTQMENFMKDMEKRFLGEVNQNFPWISSSLPSFRLPSDESITSVRSPVGFSGPSNFSTDDKFKLCFSFPQAKPEDIKVSLKDRLLTVEAKIEEEGEERRMQQSLNYQYNLPDSVDIEALESLFKSDGVLTIEAPKVPEKATRNITINRE